MEPIQFAFSDYIQLLKKHKKTVIGSMLAGAALCAFLVLSRPVTYQVVATFRDKGKMQAAISSPLTDFLFSHGNSYDSEAISSMKSRLILSEVSQKLHIQGDIYKIKTTFPTLSNARDNFLAEWAYLRNWKVPVLEERERPLNLKDISYNGEVIGVYIISFQDEHQYTVTTENGEPIGAGHVDVPFEKNKVQFTIKNPHNTPLAYEKYAVVIYPLSDVAKNYSGELAITVDPDDKSLLKLQFRHRDRQTAADFVNLLMDTYQKHLVNEHLLTSNTQVDYLEKRQQDVGNALGKLMDDYVRSAAEDMADSGFTSPQKEMDFLAANLSKNQQKMTEISLEIKRLDNINCNECVYFDSYLNQGDPAIINHFLAEIRELKHQSDILELALQNTSSSSPESVKKGLEANFKSLEATRAYLDEAKILYKTLNEKSNPPSNLKLLNTSDYPVMTWYQTYQTKMNNGASAELEQFRDHFLAYLTTFKRLLKIQEATLQQRMRAQHHLSQEFEGMSLDNSRSLYMTYVKDSNDLEAEEVQYRFIVDQLSNPQFELSSLTALLKDPISHARITRASDIIVLLKDETHRTQKERERLIEELALQKSFLSAHVLQLADLTKLKRELLQEKIASLQGVILDLIHQQISLLKKHTNDYIDNRISHLMQEKNLLEEHQHDLHKRMSIIPSKWVQEQLLNHNLSVQQKFLENLSGMVESKNITKNLEMIQSAALDRALPPLNPKPPRLLFFTLFGSILGLIGSCCFLFTRAHLRGIPASSENLKLANFHVSGFIHEEIATLRRALSHMDPKNRMILILNAHGPDFSETLANLIAKTGQRPILLDLDFWIGASNPALLHYLEGSANAPRIESINGIDKIGSGGATRYSEELLKSPRFPHLLEELKSPYDWIIAASPAKITCTEASNLAKLFNGSCIIVLTDETVQEVLAFTTALNEEQKKALTFIFSTSS